MPCNTSYERPESTLAEAANRSAVAGRKVYLPLPVPSSANSVEIPEQDVSDSQIALALTRVVAVRECPQLFATFVHSCHCFVHADATWLVATKILASNVSLLAIFSAGGVGKTRVTFVPRVVRFTYNVKTMTHQSWIKFSQQASTLATLQGRVSIFWLKNFNRLRRT